MSEKKVATKIIDGNAQILFNEALERNNVELAIERLTDLVVPNVRSVILAWDKHSIELLAKILENPNVNTDMVIYTLSFYNEDNKKEIRYIEEKYPDIMEEFDERWDWDSNFNVLPSFYIKGDRFWYLDDNIIKGLYDGYTRESILDPSFDSEKLRLTGTQYMLLSYFLQKNPDLIPYFTPKIRKRMLENRKYLTLNSSREKLFALFEIEDDITEVVIEVEEHRRNLFRPMLEFDRRGTRRGYENESKIKHAIEYLANKIMNLYNTYRSQGIVYDFLKKLDLEKVEKDTLLIEIIELLLNGNTFPEQSLDVITILVSLGADPQNLLCTRALSRSPLQNYKRRYVKYIKMNYNRILQYAYQTDKISLKAETGPDIAMKIAQYI